MANPTSIVSATTTPYEHSGKTRRDLAATAQTYYPNEMIGLDASGNATKCDDSALRRFDGLQGDSFRITVDSGDSAGDKKVNVIRPRLATMTIAAAAAGDEGRPVFAKYSNEVSYFPGTYKNFVGWVHRVVSATEVEIELCPAGGPPLVAVNIVYSSPVDQVNFVAERAYRVIGIVGRPTASAAGATVAVKKAPSGTAIASGTALHSGNYTLDGTAHTNQTLTLSTTTGDLDIADGDSIGIDCTGTTTSATGVITVLLVPVGK